MGSLKQWQNQIGAWHREVFGEYDPLDHIRAIAQKIQEEGHELEVAPDDPQEIADVLICAFAAADRLGIDMEEQLSCKMQVLVRRKHEQIGRDRERGILQASERGEK